MSLLTTPGEWLGSMFAGLLDVLGPASPAIVQTRSADGKRVHVLVREGYEQTTNHGPLKLRRRHQFADPDSLSAWLDKWAEPESTEILVSPGLVAVSLDPLDPHGDAVTCGLQLHPRAHRWQQAITNKRISQSDLHRLAIVADEDFAPVEDPDFGGLGRFGRVILAEQLRRLQVLREGSLEVRLDATGVVRFAGQTEDVQITGKLPSSFMLTIPWYYGIDAVYTIEVFLRLQVPKEGTPYLELDAPGLDVLVSEATQDVCRHIGLVTVGEFLVGLGVHATETVQDLQ